MKYITTFNGTKTMVDDDDFERLNKYRWHTDKFGYVLRSVTPYKKMYLAREVMNDPEGMQVDHINWDKLDNRKVNLRLATPRQQCFNRKNNRGISKYKGVVWHRKVKKWQVTVNSKYLGLFDTEADAAIAYNNVAAVEHGDFAVLNEVKS